MIEGQILKKTGHVTLTMSTPIMVYFVPIQGWHLISYLHTKFGNSVVLLI